MSPPPPGPTADDPIQGRLQEPDVMPLGPADDYRQRDSMPVDEETALGPFFFPGLLGFSRRLLAPEGPCPASHPDSATPKQSPPSRRTPPDRHATNAQRILAAATAESSGESRWHCQSFLAAPSTGSRCAARTRRPRKCRAPQGACGHLQAAADTCASVPPLGHVGAREVRRATKVHPRLPKIELSPCRNHSK